MVFGRHRISEYLWRDYGIKAGNRKVQGIMNELDIRSVIRRKNWKREKKTTNISFEDHIERDFFGSKLNEKWYTDVTYIYTKDRKRLYFAAIIDTFNNEIVAWKVSFLNDIKLVYDLVKAAVKNKKPKKVILHSDHASAYFSPRYKNFCKNHGIIQSNGRVGVSLDNRPIEYFFGVLKSECIRRIHLSKRTPEYIIKAINEYMHWYNNERIITKLKTSPVKYRRSRET